MRRFPPPIRFTLPALFVIFGGTLLAVELRYEIRASYAAVEERARQRAALLGTLVASEVEAGYRLGEELHAHSSVRRIVSDRSLGLALLLDAEDRVRAATEGEFEGHPLADTPLAGALPLVATARTGMTGLARISSDGGRAVAAYPLSLDPSATAGRSARIGVLVLDYDLTLSKRRASVGAQRRAVAQGGALALVGVAAWALLHLLLTRRATRLSAAALRFAEGNYGTSAGLGGSDELHVLSDTLDGMARRVNAQTEALRESERRLRLVGKALEAAANAIVITDAEGRAHWLNPAFTELTGYPSAEVLGRTLRILKSGVHDRAFYAELWETVLAGRVWRGEMVNRRLDGNFYVEEQTITPVRDETGVIHFIAVKQDITRRKEAEQALRESEARFRNLVQGTQAIVWEADASPFAFTFVSQRAEEMLGYPARQWLEDAHFLVNHLHPDDRARALAYSLEATTRGAGHELEYRFLAADGRAVWLRDIVRIVRDENGLVRGLRGLMVDISEQKEAEEALRESQAQLAAIIETAMDAVIGVDESQRIILFNAAAEKVFRVPAPEAIGEPLERFIPERFREVHGQHLRAYARAGGAAPKMRALVTGRRADGEEFPLEGSVSRVNVGGRCIFTGILRDLTERQRAEDEQSRLQGAIQNAAQEWQRTFDAMDSAVVILDGQGRVLRLNRAARDLAGRSYGECLGRKLEDLGPGQPWRKATDLLAHIGSDGAAEHSTVRDEASGRWWDLAVVAAAEDGEGRRFIAVARDATGTVELQESVRRSQTLAAMGSLVAGVAHQVRNPLFGISVNVDALEAQFKGNEDLSEVMAALRREVGRLNGVMEDLLEYGKPPSTSLAEGLLDLLLGLAVQSCTPLADGAEVTIANRVERGRWLVRMDRSRLVQVFENLLENAIRFSPRGGQVSLEGEGLCLQGEEWVRCLVADSGPGFPEQDLPRVFEPFFSRRRGGTGLGLSIAQRIVEEHGGRISAFNRGEGGAVVAVELPCVQR